MADEPTKQITVTIAGEPYPLKILPRDEASLLQIVGNINKRVENFRRSHPTRAKEAVLSMALLATAIDLHKARQSGASPSSEDLTARLSSLESYLDQLID